MSYDKGKLPIVLFTYGTLKEGQFRHDLLVENGAHYIGQDTLSGYTCQSFVGRDFPGIVPGTPDQKVRGELYAIDPKTMFELDHIEGVGMHPPLYKRQIHKLDSGMVAVVYVFANNYPEYMVMDGVHREWWMSPFSLEGMTEKIES